MSRGTKGFLQRILCWILVASLVSQNGLQTVSAQPAESEIPVSEETIGIEQVNEELGVLSEIEANRGEFSKEYLRSDNSRTVVVYPQQIHYEKKDGTFGEIDNSLAESEEGYENGSNSYDVVITDNAESQGQVIYREGDYEIAWQMVELVNPGSGDGSDDGEDNDFTGGEIGGDIPRYTLRYLPEFFKEEEEPKVKGKSQIRIRKPLLEARVTDMEEEEVPEEEKLYAHHVKQSKVTFAGYSNNVTVEYEPVADGIKENIILQGPEAGNEYIFAVQTKGLEAKLTDGNEIEFYDERTGEKLYYFPAPFMIDSEGEVSYDAYYRLINATVLSENGEATDDSNLYIKIVLSPEWLEQAAYPVTVDPVLKQCRAKNLLDTGCVGDDNTVRNELYVGRNNTGLFRSFIRFQLPNLPDQCIVSEARLNLGGETEEGDTHYITANLITEDWYNGAANRTGSQLSWNSQPEAEEVIDYALNGSYFNITKAVRQWMSGSKENYGVAFKAYNEKTKTRDKISLKYSKSTPYLKITYRTAVGLESYWGTHSTGAGTAGAGYINDYTGALTVVTPIVSTEGNRFPLSISQVYNSNATDRKWRLNYEETIKIPIDTVDIGTYPYVYTDSDGTEHYFKKKEVTYLLNGEEKTVEIPSEITKLPPAQDEDGLKLYIVPVTDKNLKNTYPLKLIDKSAGTVKYFDTFGRLAKITDSNQYENVGNGNKKVQNCVTIGFEEYGELMDIDVFQKACDEAADFKDYCHTSGVTATSDVYITALDSLAVRIEALKQSPYARADYATAKHIRTAMTALASLNEVDSTPNKATIKEKSKSILSALESAKTRVNTLGKQKDMRICSVTDAVGNTAKITWNTDGVATVSDPTYGNMPIKFSYTSGKLTGITFANKDVATYNYNDKNGLLSCQKDTDGYKVSYTYNEGDNRIVEVSESHGGTQGQTYGITYNTDNSTTFRFSGVDDVYGNGDDIENIHVFDEQGRAICIYSKSVSENKVIGATACTYQTETDNDATRNKIKDSAVVGMHSNNFLTNHSFEYNDSKWTLYKNESDAPEKGALNACYTGKKYIGTHSAYVNMAKRTSGTGGLKQSVTLAKGTYTFSAYVGASEVANTDAYLKVKTEDDTFFSNKVSKDTNIEFDNGWERLEVTFEIPHEQNVTVYLETSCNAEKGAGKVYFDCAQLEAGSVANDYNILEDGSFELTTSTLPYKWKNLSNSSIKVADERVSGGVDGSYCYKITGQPGKNKYLRFTTNLGSSKNGYVLSGWLKSNTTPTRSTRAFKVMAYHEGDEEVLQATSKINTYSEGWKYFCLLLPAESWGSTEFTICFHDNIGELYIDGLQLTRNDVQTKKYDSEGRVTSRYKALKSDNYTYDSYNRMKKHTTAAGASYIYSYAGNNEVKKVTANVGPDTHYTYDQYGNQTVSQSYASDAAETTRTQYYSSNTYTDDGNFPASSTDTAGNTTSYDYDERKGLLLSTTLPMLPDVGTVKVAYQYDNEDKITKVSQENRSVSYTYGAFDDLTGIAHNGFTYGFTYDKFGNLLTTSIAGKVISTNQYAAYNGSLVKTTLADGTVLENTYDKYGNITSNKVGGEVTNTYTFDNDGNLSRQVDKVANLTTKYDYNDSDKVVRSEVYNGEGTAAANLQSRMQYTYTKSGLVGGLSYQEQDGEVRTYAYTYAQDELPTKSVHPDGSFSTWSYDALRRSTKTVYAPGTGLSDSKKLYTTYTYQNATHNVDGKAKTTTTGLVNTYTNKFGGSGSAVSQFTYTYDSWGNITGIRDLASNERTYNYNAYGEVTRATETYSDGTTTMYTYIYDEGGNILKERAGRKTHTYTYDSVWKDKLISYDGKRITYDEAGHPLNYMGSKMSWDVNDNLTSITKGNNKISYTYLSTGERRSKTVNGTTTTYNYNNGLLLSETTGDETLRFYYDVTGKVTSIGYQKGNNAEAGYFFTRNGQGDIIGIYRSSDSKLIGTYEYDLWGKLISAKEAEKGIDKDGILTKNPFRYRGYYYDNETGFYATGARYYDPVIRRFISVDDIEYLGVDGTVNSYNLFAYCKNNPVMGSDPTGHFSWRDVFNVALVVTVAALAVIAIVGSGGSAALPILAATGTVAGTTVTAGTVTTVAAGVAITGFTTMGVAATGTILECNSSGGNKEGKNYIKAKNNKTANEWAKEAGYEGAEDLKEAYVGKSQVSKFNMVKNRETGEIILVGIKTGVEVFTDLFVQ